MVDRITPWWIPATYQAAIVPADLVMATGMLHGIEYRAQTAPPPRPSGRTPLSTFAD